MQSHLKTGLCVCHPPTWHRLDAPGPGSMVARPSKTQGAPALFNPATEGFCALSQLAVGGLHGVRVGRWSLGGRLTEDEQVHGRENATLASLPGAQQKGSFIRNLSKRMCTGPHKRQINVVNSVSTPFHVKSFPRRTDFTATCRSSWLPAACRQYQALRRAAVSHTGV